MDPPCVVTHKGHAPCFFWRIDGASLFLVRIFWCTGAFLIGASPRRALILACGDVQQCIRRNIPLFERSLPPNFGWWRRRPLLM